MNERTISASAHTKGYFLGWTTGFYPQERHYNREFSSLVDMAKFICKYPEREYIYINEQEMWTEERENFMGFNGISKVSCAKVTRNFMREDNIYWGEIAKISK